MRCKIVNDKPVMIEETERLAFEVAGFLYDPERERFESKVTREELCEAYYKMPPGENLLRLMAITDEFHAEQKVLKERMAINEPKP